MGKKGTFPSQFALTNPDFSHHLMEALPGPSLLCDARNIVRGWNKQALSALGLPAERLIGHPLPDLFHGSQAQSFSQALDRARRRYSRGHPPVSGP